MEEVTYWRADDGKIFDDEDDCRDYEFSLNAKALEGRVFLLDRYCRPLPLTDYNSYTDAYFIFMVDDSAWSDLYDAWPDFDSYFPHDLHDADAGLWAYDDHEDNWYHMGKKIADLQSTADKCMKSINGG